MSIVYLKVYLKYIGYHKIPFMSNQLFLSSLKKVLDTAYKIVYNYTYSIIVGNRMPIFTKDDLYNKSNNMLIRNIFYEWNPEGLLTLDKNGKEGKVCLFKLYMAHTVDDPSEVTFAEEVFGDLFFWQCLAEANWFQQHISEWRHLAAIKRKQKAFKAIIKEVEDKGRSSFSAAKYLIEEPWKIGSAAERKKVRKQISDTAEAALGDSSVQSDLKRLKEQGLIQ